MPNETCGILVGPDEIRAIALSNARGKLKIIGTGYHDLSIEEREAPGAVLRAMVRRVKPAPESAYFCLPKEQANLHQAVLPSNDPNELKEMARFEAERIIPFNAERHSVGFHNYGSTGSASDVLLASADGPIVERVLKTAEDSGVRSQGLTVSSVALMNALLFASGDVVRQRNVLLISIGLGTVDLVFSVQGRMVFSRSVPVGLRGLIHDWQGAQGNISVQLDAARTAVAAKMIDMMDLDRNYTEGVGSSNAKQGDAARMWANRLVQEIKKSYGYARRERNCPTIDMAVLAGEGVILRNLAQYLYVNLNVEVVALNPVGELDPESVRHLPFGGLELTVPFGTAVQDLIPDGYRVDLTPSSYYRRIEHAFVLRQAIISGGLLLALLVLGSVAFVMHARRQATLFEAYTEMNNQLYPYVQSLDEEKQKLDILEGFLDDPSNALAVLNAIASYPNTPDRVSFKSLNFASSEQVILEGHAIEIPDINNFAEYLRLTELFETVTVTKQDLRKVLSDRPQLYDFHIACVIPEFKAVTRTRERTAVEDLGPIDPDRRKLRETEYVPATTAIQVPSPGAARLPASSSAETTNSMDEETEIQSPPPRTNLMVPRSARTETRP